MPDRLPGDQRSLIIERVAIINLPTPQRGQYLAIRMIDWRRLRRGVQGIQQPGQWLSTSYGALAGIAASSFLSVFPLVNAQGLPAWLVPSYVAAGIAAAAVALVFFLLERKTSRDQGVSTAVILRDMDEMEQMDENQ